MATDQHLEVMKRKFLAALSCAEAAGSVLMIDGVIIRNVESGVALYISIPSPGRRGTFESRVDTFIHDHSPPPKSDREHYALM